MEKKLSQYTVEPLLAYFDRMIPLNQTEKDLVREKFYPRLFRKRQFVLQEGNVCNQIYFVVRGLLRMYKIDDKGVTHVLQFAIENNWINDLGSFHQRKPSAMNIDAVEDTVVLETSYDDLISLYSAIPKLNHIFRVLVENAYVRLQERLMQNISSTAEERYECFLEVYPLLTNRLSQIQIASFLGVTPEFLSRVRNKRVKSAKS